MPITPPAGAVPSTRSAVRQPAAVSKARLSSYVSLAVVPTTLLVANADADIYFDTSLSLRIGYGGLPGTTNLNILGAGGLTVGQLALRASFTYTTLNPGAGSTVVAVSYAHIRGANFSWRTVQQVGTNTDWFGGLPVGANATWSNVGRNPSDFPGSAQFGTDTPGDVNFAELGANPGAIDFDPQRVGNTGATWYLLFKHTDGSSDTYGWLSFEAYVNGIGNPDAGRRSYIVITGWGYDDSGNPLGAGVTAAAVPGGAGLASLAFGAAGLRGRRRSRN